MSRNKMSEATQLNNIQLSLERFDGNPILKPDAKHLWETKLSLIRPRFMKAVRCTFFTGLS